MITITNIRPLNFEKYSEALQEQVIYYKGCGIEARNNVFKIYGETYNTLTDAFKAVDLRIAVYNNSLKYKS